MYQRVISFVLFLIYTLASTPSLSAIRYTNMFDQYELIQNETKELNLTLLANIELMLQQNRINLENYIPLIGIPNYDDGSIVSRRILKQTLKFWTQNSQGWNNSLIDSAEAINSAVSTKIATANGHSVSLKLKPFEALATLNYEGAVDASFSYDVSDGNVVVAVEKKNGDKTYAYTITSNNSETINKIGLTWNF